MESYAEIIKYINGIHRRKRLFTLAALGFMTAVLVVCYALPNEYEAKTTVFIEEHVINDLVEGIAVTPSMNSKVKALSVTLLSRHMLHKVLRALDMDLEVDEGQELEELIKEVRERMSIQLDEQKGVFIISYRDPDPVLARDVVNTLVRLYIEESTSFKRQESFQASKFLGEQIEAFQKRIEEAEKEIDAYQREKGVLLSVDEATVHKELEEAEEQLALTQGRIDELRASRRVLAGNTPARKRLKALKNQLEVLRNRYTDNHPRIILIKDEIALLDEQVKTGKAGSGGIYGSPEYQQIQVQLNSLGQRKKHLQAEIEEAKLLLREIPPARAGLEELVRKRDNEVVIYEKLVSRYGQSEVAKQMELQDKSVSYRILDQAILPTIPASPNRTRIIFAGILGGFAFAIGLIVLLEMLNPSVRTVDDVKEIGLPVFATIPKMDSGEGLDRVSARDVMFYVGAGLYFAVIVVFLVIERLDAMPQVVVWVKELVR